MDIEQDDAVTQLGGLALGQVLQDLGVVGADSDLSRIGLGSKKTATTPALHREEIYRNDFDDDADDDIKLGPVGQDDEDDTIMEDVTNLRKTPVNREPGRGKFLVRGEEEDFADEDEEDHQEGDARKGMVQLATVPTTQPPLNKTDELVAPKSALPYQQQQAEPPMSPTTEARMLFPDFQPGKLLDFTELFGTRSLKRRKLIGRLPQYTKPHVDISVRESDKDEFFSAEGFERERQPTFLGRIVNPHLADQEYESAKIHCQVLFDDSAIEDQSANGDTHEPTQLLNNVEVDDWQRRVLLDSHKDQAEFSTDEKLLPPVLSMETVSRPRNHELAKGMWFENIIWNPHHPFRRFDRLLMDMNDAEMILENENTQREKQVSLLRADAPPNLVKSSKFAAELDPFNLSNDRMYEMSKEHRHRVRQTLGQLVVRHAWPAIKLQLPFYKTRLSKHETRSWHRPRIQFPSNMPITFSRVRTSRKSKDGERKSKDPSEVLHSTRDLTLKDASNYIMCEYSEEYPPLLSNIGMGSLLVNYYRKKDAKDDHIPRSELGEAFVLDITDESPFMKFGSVEPGQTQPVLYNNMTRAPLFRHKPSQNDFLFIRSTTKNDVRYYLRDVPNLYVVGQTYPTTPIPGPHARLVTNNIKYRLQMITYKLVEKSHAHRIKIHRVMKYFPDQNELQMRQRLKEFMVYNRKSGDVHQGFWRLKPDVPIPDEAELQKLLTPEHICLVEGMQVGQRHLLDAGFTKTAEGADDDADESKLEIEQLLAPWITSKNFLHATQGKAMLKLHGEGDPSGRGEAFSFVRVSMKEIFLRAGEDVDERLAAEAETRAKSGHRYNVAEQQAIYRSEIARIWKAQLAALSNPEPPRITAKEEQLWRDEQRRERKQQEQKATRPLLVKRLFHGVWYKHIVRDPSVINAYVKQRQEIEEQSIVTESLVPTGDAALDAMRKKRLEEEIAARVKNQDRRLQRKNAKAAAEGIDGGYKKMPNKTNTKRRCGRCGQVGHMLTNNACPQYHADKANSGRPGASGANAVRPPSVMPMPNSTYYTSASTQQQGTAMPTTFPPFGMNDPMGPQSPPPPMQR